MSISYATLNTAIAPNL